MANRNIDESIRKPRRTKGTPFYKLRNYYTLGFLGLTAATAVFYEYWSQTRKLRQSLVDGKFEYSTPLKDQIVEYQWGNSDPHMRQIVQQLKEKKE